MADTLALGASSRKGLRVQVPPCPPKFMASFRTYLISAQLAWATEFAYRINFIFGRLRELLSFAALFLIYRAVPFGVRNYSQHDLYTYLIVSTLVSAVVIVFGMHEIADEIADGSLTNFLVKPANYFLYWTSRVSATRLLLLVSGAIQVLILAKIFGINFLWPKDLTTGLFAAALFLGAIILVQIIDFITASVAFWAHHSHAPRFLVLIIIQFLSGAYIPIDALPKWAARIMLLTPFPSMVYAPVKVWMGKSSLSEIGVLILTQWIWIVIAWLALRLIWARGAANYESYGR